MSTAVSKDYERKVQSRETLIEVAMIRLMLSRLAGERDPYQTRSNTTAAVS